AAIDALIGMSRARFLHSTIFGQAAPLFMDLSVPERGLLLDEIMSLGIWLRMSEFAGKESERLKRELIEIEKGIAYSSGLVQGSLEQFDEVEAAQRAWQQQCLAQVCAAPERFETALG